MSDKRNGRWLGFTDKSQEGGLPTSELPDCSFCGLGGRRGVAGPTPAVYICFDCVELAAEIKAESLGEPGAR